MIQPADNYTIKIAQFEGPFDLLLFFIERDELDIFDIPISTITQDFLDYIRTLEELNIDVASEFILVAATLMRIKAKMLIPRPELDEHGHEIDPREELARRLVEYKKFKDVIDDLAAMEEARYKVANRGNRKSELRAIASKALVDVELESLTLYGLMRSFENVMKRLELSKRRPRHIVYRYDYNVEEQKDYILSKIKKGKKSTFETIFGGLRDRLHAIITFLALLEMINAQEISIVVGNDTNNFWLETL